MRRMANDLLEFMHDIGDLGTLLRDGLQDVMSLYGVGWPFL